MSSPTLDDLVAKGDDDLYAILGASLLGDGISLAPGDRSGHRQFGREWFQNKRRMLQNALCDHPRVETLLGNSTADSALDVLAVVELVRETLDETSLDPVQSAVIAILVSRLGLHMFCANRIS